MPDGSDGAKGRVDFGWGDEGRTIGDGSMDFDYCQGNSTFILSFECETGKWSGLRRLAGNWEFGETV